MEKTMSQSKSCAVPATARTVIEGADYADAYEAEYHGHHAAIDLARKVMMRGPRWLGPLMALRNALVRPFGLESETPLAASGIAPVGFFPVQFADNRRAVLGFDDKHLDFRLVADAILLENGNTRLILSTVIKRHNWLGSTYLALVLPFHKVIVPAFLHGGLP
jgi:Protein of unknown function (DUF2867)